MNDKEKIKEVLKEIDTMIHIEEDDLEQGVPCSPEKIDVLESIKAMIIRESEK